ncbi:MAG: hypothetical protein K2M79_02550 [Muribaculaceae bacterium]|nr:hypothetical protein [Muribaculaceae bacterium]
MKKSLLLILGALIATLDAIAVPPYASTPATDPWFCNGFYSGCYDRVDSIRIWLHPNRRGTYEFGTENIPAIKFGDTEYPGRTCATRDTIYWTVNILAPDRRPDEPDTYVNYSVVANFPDIPIVDKTDNTVAPLRQRDAGLTSGVTYGYSMAKYYYTNMSYFSRKHEYQYLTPISVPGEYSILAGEYGVGVGFQNAIHCVESFTNDEFPSGQPRPMMAIVVKDDGTPVASYPVSTDGPGCFKFNLQEPITEPGKYYILYDVAGRLKGHDLVNHTSLGGTWITMLKNGPYVVSEPAARKTVLAQITGVPFDILYTDNLPTLWRGQITNATVLYTKPDIHPIMRCVKPDGSEVSAEIEITCDDNFFNFHLDAITALLTAGGEPEAGNYMLYLDNPDQYMEGYNSNTGAFVTLSNRAYQNRVMNLLPAAPDDELVVFKEHKGSEIELEDGEILNIRLGMHMDDATQQVFYRWIPLSATQRRVAATDAPEGFVKHTGSIEVSEPGTLEYYTQKSNTISDVKTVNVVAKKAENEGPQTKIEAVIADIPQGDEAYFDIKGVRIPSPSQPGVYIHRRADGKVVKELIK